MTWDYDPIEYEKQAAADERWHLERLIRYGLGKEKIKREVLEKYIHELDIPEDRRTFLELLLWDKKF
jgi:hypothetical protein